MSSQQKQQQKNGENNAGQFKKVGVIFNPAANKGYAKVMFEELVHPLLIKYFGERIHQVFETRKAGGGFDGAVQMAKEGCDLILACGGDGTLHEVVNGLLKKAQNSDAQELLPAISVLPLGTSDDFATHVQLSCKCVPQLSKEAAYESFVESLSRSGTVLNIDIGSVTATKVSINQETQVYDKLNEQNTEYFINEASCGIGADVIDTVNRASSLWNKAFYNSFQALWKQFTYQNRDLEWKLTNENDETVVDSGVSQLLVMGNARYFGNGMMICPDALLNDGLFQITHLSNVNAVNALSIIPKLFSGTQSQHPKVTHHTAVKAEVSCIRSDADAIVLIEADGEIAGALPATFSIVRDALRFVVPSTHPLYGH